MRDAEKFFIVLLYLSAHWVRMIYIAATLSCIRYVRLPRDILAMQCAMKNNAVKPNKTWLSAQKVKCFVEVLV